MRAKRVGTVVAGTRIAVVGALAFGLLSAAAAEVTLLEAAESGDTATALRLLSDGGDARMRGADGTTPLMWAAYHGDVELARADRGRHGRLGAKRVRHVGDHRGSHLGRGADHRGADRGRGGSEHENA